MRRLKALAFLPVLFFLAVMAAAQTQSTTGVIQGTVSDNSGAVMAGASVEIVNVDTNLKRTYTTDSDGRFVALTLPPGSYTVSVSKSGYAPYKAEGIILLVGNAVNLSPKLGVSGGSTVVTVTGTPDIDPTKTESSSTLNERTVAQTPVLGRKFEDLLTLTPGVSVVQGPDGDEINFNGQRGIFNNVSLDGGDYNNGFFGEQSGGQRAAVDITMDAIKEFQVIAASSSAEFGRTAGGVINVVTKSGTNDLHGSLFYYYRGENLSSNTSDGKPLKDFNRNQFGATIGGPIKKDKAFFFLAAEQITANLQRDNLSAQVGPTACPIPAPTILANEALINANTDCQRLALVNFIQTTRGTNEALPVRRPKHNTAVLGKVDFNLTPRHTLSISHNFDASRDVNETFDVPTYGSSANGIEGTSYINATNVNLVSTLSNTLVNEAHFSYNHETRPRKATPSNVPADTAMGFATTFRFGNPFFLGPTVDETFKRFHLKDNVSWIKGKHTFKFGGEWLHSNNAQVFRGFFEGRYIFDSVTGFLRYASAPAPGGFGPATVGCSNGTYVTAPATCVGPATATGGPLLLYLQGAKGDLTTATDATGASDISNESPALFFQDKWQFRPNVTFSYGLRWEAQTFPGPTVDPSKTAYGPFLSNPKFPSNGKLPSQYGMIQPRVGFAWDLFSNTKSVIRASWGMFNGYQNMLTQVGSITTNGVQQATIFLNTPIIAGSPVPATAGPTWPKTVSGVTPFLCGSFPCFSGVRVFDRNYHNPRIYTTNVAFEQAFEHNIVVYVDFTHSKGVYLTNFLDYNRADRGAPFAIALGETMVASSRANSLYRGVVFGLRKSFSNHFQADVNYTWASDWDNDSNERDPFTDRSGPATPADPFPLRNDYSPSDRDIRHKFNFLISGDMPWGFQGNLRIQAHSAQPITDPTCGKRNCFRKDNQYASIDWRLARPFHFGDRYAIIPTIEMFNMANAANNVNPLISPGLFNFDGYLRQGVGDPRQVQLAVKFTF